MVRALLTACGEHSQSLVLLASFTVDDSKTCEEQMTKGVCSPARSHAYWTMRLDRLGGPCPGSASLRPGRRAAKRSRPMHHRSVAFCLPPPSPEIYEL